MKISSLVVLLALTLTSNQANVSGSRSKAALVIIDVQDCFISGGSLAVNGANEIIPIINNIRVRYQEEFSLVVLSKDYHPAGHVSFASSHPGALSPITLRYSQKGKLCLGISNITKQDFPEAITCANLTSTLDLQQALWPDHCIQGVTTGPTSSALATSLDVQQDDLIIEKGVHKEVDSYSAFFDNGGFGETNLDKELKQRGITHVFVTGLAGDYCVYYTSLDAHKLGYETYYVMDATRSVSDQTRNAAIAKLVQTGVHVINSDRIGENLDAMNKSPANKQQNVLLLMTSFLVFSTLCNIL